MWKQHRGGLVYRKHSSSFLGEIRMLPRRCPLAQSTCGWPGPHWGFQKLHSLIHIPIPSQSALASGTLSKNPGLPGLDSSSNTQRHCGDLGSFGDKSHTWRL